MSSQAFISQIKYDSEANIFIIELTGLAGTNLTDWSLVLYNANNGLAYEEIILTATLTNQSTDHSRHLGFTTIALPKNKFNNRSNGIALIDPNNNLLQFLSYEGSFVAVNGPAMGITSTDIGVFEGGEKNIDHSLPLTGLTSAESDLTWETAVANTSETANTEQSLSELSANPFISEIHYDNVGSDVGEFIEVTGEAGANLDGYTLVLYNGNGGTTYNTVNLTGTFSDEINGQGAIAFDILGIQNGAPDGVALVDSNGAVVEFLSYEGAFTAVGGAADGLSSTDIAVAEDNSTQIGESLQKIDGVWKEPASETKGMVNMVSPVSTISIHTIQGAGTSSPLIGTTVAIEGIVVGDFQGSSGLSGFFVQEEDADADADPNTSEGIFVFDGSSPAVEVNVGDLVRVVGEVAEFGNLTELTKIDSITIINSGNELPTAATVNFPLSAVDDLEAVEGMLTRIPDTLYVTEYFNLDRFGSIRLSSDGPGNAVGTDGRLDQFTQYNAPSTSGFATHLQEIANRSIELDDGSDEQNPDSLIFGRGGNPLSSSNTLRGGDTIAGLTGILDERFGSYRIQTKEGVDFQPTNTRPDTPGNVGGTLKVASFNVLNYFTTLDDGSLTDNGLSPRGADTPQEFARQTEKLVTSLAKIKADVFGLVELENSNTSAALANLTAELNARILAETGMAGTYDYINTGLIGTDAITVGILYNSATVTPVGNFAVLDDPSFTDPNSTGQQRNRPALGQTFQELASGEKFTPVVNHFKSKGSSGLAGQPLSNPDVDQLDGQGFWNDTRTQAAQTLVNWLDTDPTSSGDPDFLIIGDLNAYAQEDPIQALIATGYTDIAQSFLGTDAYSFVFDGQLGTLDYALANPSMLAQITGVDEWHVNADEPDALDYNLDFGRDPSLFEGTTPFRNSDHDPIIVGLNLAQTPIPDPGPETGIRLATFNISQFGTNIFDDFATFAAQVSTGDDPEAQQIAEIIQRSNPDVLLLNEFDVNSHDIAASKKAVQNFISNYLNVSQNGADPVDYPFIYVAPSNTGIASGFDLDNNGTVGTTPGTFDLANDALGFGLHPGQFGMVLLSKYEIDEPNIRTFQKFLWKDMPGALLPKDPNDADGNGDLDNWYTAEELEVVRLSSKSHWDIPIKVNGEIIHVLASHPTPPVFDGSEDRNGTRNHDEIRFWSDYVTPGAGDYIYDDSEFAQAGNTTPSNPNGGLGAGERFVIMGDQNADPFDGDSTDGAIQQLLNNPLVNVSVTPSSTGGPDAAFRQNADNDSHLGDPALDTSDFGEPPGNLRVDYVLPSQNLNIENTGIFWPATGEAFQNLVSSSDHRLVYADVTLARDGESQNRKTVTQIDFLGEVTFATGTEFEETEIGGLSGITYDQRRNVYYSISDDRSQIDDARFYTLAIDLNDGSLDDGDVRFIEVTTLLDGSGNPFMENSLDPEGIALTSNGTLFISSEGDKNDGIQPFINQFSLAGQEFEPLPIPGKFLIDDATGIRNNLAFESVTITPDQRFLYTAVENALLQDGPQADVDQGSLVRIIKYDLTTNQVVGEFVYEVDEVAEEPIPSDSFRTNGLVELLAIDNNGTLLALERSFSGGVGNTVKIFEVRTQGALDVSNTDALADQGIPFEIDPAVQKRELLDIERDLGIAPDNLEGLAFGPQLPDGRQSLIVISDNNFNASQTTQFLAFALDFETTPTVLPKVETPLTVDEEEGDAILLGDSDDPAIWVNPENGDESIVIGTLKDGGLAVFDLDGELLQTVLPTPFGDIRYNNVDLVYGFDLDDEDDDEDDEDDESVNWSDEDQEDDEDNKSVDLAVVSDRENDTLTIFKINPETRQLEDITSDDILETIFGVDDGEATAYGLATYTSPVDGTAYAFVTQADGNQVAQLKLFSDDDNSVNAQVVRILELPVPTGNPEDSQSEGIVVDQELGFVYVALEEEVGILKFSAEADGGDNFQVIQPIDADYLVPDLEGLSIYYGSKGTGYLIANSQGDSSYAVFSREGSNEYLGSFVVGDNGDIDQVNESDGLDTVNVSLGSSFPHGLVVLQDGANDPQNVVEDDAELENNSTNFKFVDWADIAASFDLPLIVDPTGYDPRNPQPQSLVNGVASGDVTQDSAVLWTRSTFPGEVSFKYSKDADFSTIAGSATATVTEPEVPVKVLVNGLEPGTEYFFRVTDAAGSTEAGRFLTASELGERNGLTFGISGDWQQAPPYPILNSAAESNLNLFIKLGDTIYADLETPALPGVSQARTLDDFRTKHSEILSPRFGLSATSDLQATTSILATIDDHELVDNFAGGAAPGESPDAPDIGSSPEPLFTDDVDFVNDTQAYENALQAYQEYQPLLDEFYDTPSDPRTDGERKLYRANDYGSDASIFVLDSRSFRDAQLEPADLTNPVPFLVQAFDPTRTLLGRAQVDLLKADLLKAHENGTTWKFVVIPEPIQNFGVINAEDRFEGYAAERTEILKFIDDNDIDNVVFMAGDFHGTIVNNLTYQVAPGQEQIATNAFEVVTGPVAFFDGRFGPNVANISFAAGLISESEFDFYNSLPVAPDGDDIPNDKDDFIKQLLVSQTDLFGYDPVGLNNNLPSADGLIDATLLQGDYLASHNFSWSEFDIDPETQKLTVTTYGIDAYSEEDVLDDPAAIISQEPQIISQFEVLPQESLLNEIVGTDGDDNLGGTDGDDRILGFEGDDFLKGRRGNDILLGNQGDDGLFGGWGNDTLYGNEGDDLLKGGSGSDSFVLARGEGTDFILDFEINEDLIALAGSLQFEQLDINTRGNRTFIEFENEILAILRGTPRLTETSFAIV